MQRKQYLYYSCHYFNDRIHRLVCQGLFYVLIRGMVMYEYKVIRIQDESSGLPDRELIEKALMDHAAEGWRFVGITTNEIGHTSRTSGYGGVSQSTNATIDCTVIILEREIQKTSENKPIEAV